MVHTEEIMKKLNWSVWPVVGIVGVRMVMDLIGALRISGIRAQLTYWSTMLPGNILVVLGWVVGWMVVDLDKYAAKYGAKLGNAASFLQQWQAGIKNVLTVIALVIAGLWVVTSTGNFLAMGLVLGLQIRLFSLMYQEVDYKKWFWVFARNFGQGERNLFMVIWAVALVLQVVFVIRT